MLTLTIPAYSLMNLYFTRHLHSFGTTDPFVQAHFDLKVTHTYHVVRNIRQIARREMLDEQTIQLASVIALLHDLGRFRQFRDFLTFDDSISLNHAELSVQIMQEEGFTESMSPDIRDVITRSILQHNIPALTEKEDPQVILHSRLLRDADKMDIWKIQTEMDVVHRIRTFDQADCYEIPDTIRDHFRHGEVVQMFENMSLNDFRLLRLSWIFDMNFTSTFELLNQKKYAQKLLAKIPSSPELKEISTLIMKYMQARSVR